MAITSYSYSVAGDTANGAVDISSLRLEIVTDPTPIPGHLGSAVSGDDLTITFTDTLSGPEEAALDAVVAAHEGIVTPDAATSNPAVTGKTRAATVADVPGAVTGALFNKFETTADGPLVADGVSLVAGDAVLFEEQNTASQNVRWVVSVTGGVGVPAVLTRDDSLDYSLGMEVLVEEGTVNAGVKFRVSTAPAVVGVNDVAYSIVSGKRISFQNVRNTVDLESFALLVYSFGFDLVDHVTAAALPAHTKSGTTLTASANGALSVDGSAVDDNQEILIKDEPLLTYNGLATVTDKGSAGTPWIVELHDPPTALQGSYAGILIKNAPHGAENGDKRFYCTTGGVAGTDSLTFALAISALGLGETLASAGDLTLGVKGNVFHVSGAVQIDAIVGVRWVGREAILIFDSTPLVKHNTAGGAGTFPIKLDGAVDFAATADDVLRLVFDGSYWREVSRTTA